VAALIAMGRSEALQPVALFAPVAWVLLWSS